MIDPFLVVIIMPTSNPQFWRLMLVLLTRFAVQDEQTSYAKHLSPDVFTNHSSSELQTEDRRSPVISSARAISG